MFALLLKNPARRTKSDKVYHSDIDEIVAGMTQVVATAISGGSDGAYEQASQKLQAIAEKLAEIRTRAAADGAESVAKRIDDITGDIAEMTDDSAEGTPRAQWLWGGHGTIGDQWDRYSGDGDGYEVEAYDRADGTHVNGYHRGGGK